MTTIVRSSGPSLWKLIGRSVQLWIGLFFLLFGLVFLTIGAQEAWKEQAYRTQGLSMDAVVLDKSLVKAKRGENNRTRYVITYRFVLQQGEPKEGAADVSVEEWERLEPGRTFRVTYLPGDPDSSRSSGGEEWIGALVFLCIGGVFALLGGFFSFGEVRFVVRAIRVLRHGIVTDGTVLRASPTGTSINRVRQWQIQYRYRDHFGRTQEGVSHLVSPEEGSIWKEGDRGSVRFDRARPEISLWMGAT